MRFAYDLQACLTDSRDRGIGRYAHNLVSAMVEIANDVGGIDSVIALDGTDPARLRDARGALRRQGVAAQTAVYSYPSSAVTDIEPWRAEAAAVLRGRFFEAMAPDAFLHTSHFETGTNYTTEIKWRNGRDVPSAVVAYDLIPLVYPERYLPPGHFISEVYPRKCESFRNYDRFLAISEATRADLMQYLDIPAERIHMIGAGLDPALLAAARSGERFHDELLEQFDIREPFVLMIGNGDWRKNTMGTVEAFARLPRSVRDHHLLVLAQVGDDVKHALATHLQHISRRVRVLGKVDDDTLATLYHRCAVFFFPSLYEGFGLPVLEAMAFGAPVLSSSLGSLPEVVHDQRCLFDPRDEEATTSILARALDNRDFREVLQEGAAEHAQTFTWQRCAESAFHAMTQLASGVRADRANVPAPGELRVSVSDLATWSEFVRRAPVDVDGLEQALRTAARKGVRRMLVDITEVVRMDARSGIQRVVRNFCTGLSALAMDGSFVIQPIWWTEQGVFKANEFARNRLGLELEGADDLLDVQANDLLLMLDSSWWIPERFDSLHAEVRAAGGEVVWMVYDLIPILLPHTCDTGMAETFDRWLRHAVATSDGFVCISEATRADLESFMDRVEGYSQRPWTRSVHLGSDLEQERVQAPGEDALSLVRQLEGKPYLMAIGTIEPRKDYSTVLAAFERSWASGADCALVIVGKQGWNVDALARKIRNHHELGRRLFWLEGLEDGDLDHLLAHASALVQASLSEGFGLPIVEAGSRGMALLLSDIPVFREIAGRGASYFPVGDASRLAALISEGASSSFRGPGKGTITTKTWSQASADLSRLLLA